MAKPKNPLLDPLKSNFSSLTANSTPAIPALNSNPANSTPAPINYTPAPQQTMAPLTYSQPQNYTPVPPSLPEANSGSNAYTVRSGDTLSAIASRNNMSLKDLLDLNPQYQANPNLIRPGEAVNLRMGPSGTTQQNYTPVPQNYTPVPNGPMMTPVPGGQSMLPYTPYLGDVNNQTIAPNQSPYTPPANPAPVVPQIAEFPSNVEEEAPLTSDGQKINEETGGVMPDKTNVTVPDLSSLSATPAASTPAAPSAGSSVATSPGYESAVAEYAANLNMTPEEIANQERINKLEESFSKAYTGEGQRAIPLEFITGRQRAIEQRALDLAKPLEARAALLQAKRVAALNASKFKLEQEGLKLDREQAASRPIAGTSFFDPITREFIQAPETATDSTFTLGEGQIRYDANGNIIAANTGTGGQGSGVVSSDAAYWASLINAGKASLSDVPSDFRTEVARAQATIGGLSKASQDAITQAGVVMNFVDEVYPTINGFNTGITGKATANIPGTDAYNLERKIDTIKANVGFSALQAMRAASPTGGALGQVSEMENRLLQATLGSLDIGQSPEQLRANLEKVKKHFTNLINVLNQAAQPTSQGGDTAEDGGFNW